MKKQIKFSKSNSLHFLESDECYNSASLHLISFVFIPISLYTWATSIFVVLCGYL